MEFISKRFDLDNVNYKTAKIHITADSRYVLYINDKKIGRGPVRSWLFQLYYDTYEAGHLLTRKENTIVVLVQHYGVTNFRHLKGRDGMIAQLDVEYQEVEHTIVKSDSNWITISHPEYDSRTS